MSMTSFTEPKHPGFCEWWFRGGTGPEYSNAVSGALMSLVVLYFLWRNRGRGSRDTLEDVVYFFLFWNGVASCIFHYTLYALPGSLDTLTMVNATYCLLLVVLRVNASLSPTIWPSFVLGTTAVITSAWCLTLVLTLWPGSGIDFTWLFVGSIFCVLLALLHQCRLDVRTRPNITIARCIALFLGVGALWISTEPWCETEVWARNLFFFHSFWHLGTVFAVCGILQVQTERRLTLCVTTPIPSMSISVSHAEQMYAVVVPE